jgi:hypothetical protein
MAGKRVRCKTCGDVIQSLHRHDLKWCKCGNIFVDGGTDYLRCGWPSGALEDHVEILDEPDQASRDD